MVKSCRDNFRTKNLASESKKMKHMLINTYIMTVPGALRSCLEEMKNHGSRVESEIINEIDDEPVNDFLLEYYSSKETNNNDDVLVGNNNQRDDAENEEEEDIPKEVNNEDTV